ncbi:MAG TPA: TfoX/Sxy family protein [Balneolales bacterium]|nr:TfoX/Sxy family protein [Balneolales bacterium]
MSVSTGYKIFVLEQLGQVTNIRSRNMFGAVGLYADEFFIGIIDDDRLYFKVDDTNRPDFVEKGMDIFHPYEDERTMAFYEVPIEVIEDVDELDLWCAKAIDVARNAKNL